MGYKYTVLYKNYGDFALQTKISKYFITALFYLIYYSIKYDCVDFCKREDTSKHSKTRKKK